MFFNEDDQATDGSEVETPVTPEEGAAEETHDMPADEAAPAESAE